jgi:heptosyltransferase-1
MRVLIVKTSSLGDIIHALPALTDAGNAIPGITFDWVVEENFAAIPAWHPLVRKIIPLAWRRWRKNIFSLRTLTEIFTFRKNLRAEKYDLVIDAQGLVKSAIFSRLARGVHSGLDWSSAREKYAALFYQKTCTVVFQQHAVVRARSLLSQLLGYALPHTDADYGIDRQNFLPDQLPQLPYLVFFHGTTWVTKHWPEAYWIELVGLANAAGYPVKLPWGSPLELERAERIAAASASADVLPPLGIAGVAAVIAGAKAVVSVDTGLGHLAAAFDVPAVSIYGPTNPAFTGALGKSQVHLAVQFPCAPCFSKVCTYRPVGKASGSGEGSGAGNGVSSFNVTSSLDPQCFLTLLPITVWGALGEVI